MKQREEQLSWLEKGVIALFIFLPFQFALNIGEGFDGAIFRFLVLGLALLCFGHATLSGRWKIPTTTWYWWGMIWGVGMTLSSLWAHEQEWALRKVLFLWNFLFLYGVVGWALRERLLRARALAWACVFSGGISALVAIGQFFFALFVGVAHAVNVWREGISPFFLGGSFSEAVTEYSSWLVNIAGETVFRAIGAFPDPHIAAFYWELCLPWAVVMMWKQRSKWAFISVALLSMALLLTFSRGAYISLFVGGIISMFLFTPYTRKYGMVFLGGAWALVALLVIIPNNPIIERALSSFSLTDTSNTGRLALWDHAINTLQQHPQGVGLGNYALEVLPSAEYRDPIYAHNTYLDIAVEGGVVMGGIFLLWLGGALYLCWKRRKEDIFSLATFFSLLLFGTHAFFDTPIFSVHVFPLLLMMLAYATYRK